LQIRIVINCDISEKYFFNVGVFYEFVKNNIILLYCYQHSE